MAATVRAAPLVTLAAVVVVGASVGVIPRWPGIVHLVALPPLDQLADLRVLLVNATSIPVFVMAWIGALCLRVVVLAAVLGGVDRPHLRLAAAYHLTLLPLTAAAAAVTFAGSASLYYLLFWLGLALSLAVVALAAAAPRMPGARLRERYRASIRSRARLGTVGAYLAALLVLGGIADTGGEWVAVGLVPLSAGLTFLTARALADDPGWVTTRRIMAALPALALASLVAVVVTGPGGPPVAARPQDPRPQTLFLMSGVDSSSGRGAMLEIDPHTLGWTCSDTRYVSYAGPGDGQPQRRARCRSVSGAPYRPEDTLRSTEHLVASLDAQLARGPSPAVLAAHSQGVWISWTAAADGRLPHLEALALVGAFPDNPAPYRVDGTGSGRLGGPILRVISDWATAAGFSVFEPGSPLGVEWLGHPTAISETMRRRLPDHIRAVSITSVFDQPLMPHGFQVHGAVDACPLPVPHPNLPYAAELHDVVRRFLDGRELPPCPIWRRAVGPLTRPFAASRWQG